MRLARPPSTAAVRAAASRWQGLLEGAAAHMSGPTLRPRDEAHIAAAEAIKLAVKRAVSQAPARASASAAVTAAAAPAVRRGEGSALQSQLGQCIDVLNQGLLEREKESQLLLLALVCGEHVLLLGPPGTAKSELARRLAAVAPRGGYFERQLTRFSLPEELFGPLSLAALQHDRLERKTDGYLPCASVAFLDEIFKASSATLNSLLLLLNERKFDNGDARHSVPLQTLVGASNEPPESDELDALHDRFLFRRSVHPVSEASWPALIAMPSAPSGSRDGGADGPLGEPAPTPALHETDLLELREAAADVRLQEGVLELLLEALRALRARAESEGLPPPSDRRIRRASRALRVAALAEGRETVSVPELLLLPHMLCAREADARWLEEWIEAHMEKAVADVSSLQFVASGLFASVWDVALQPAQPDGSGTPQPEALQHLRAEAERLADALRVELSAVATPGGEKEPRELPGFAGGGVGTLWLTSDEAERSGAALGRGALVRQQRLEALFEDAEVMRAACELGSLNAPTLLMASPDAGRLELMRMLRAESSHIEKCAGLRVLHAMGQDVGVDVDF